MPKLEHPYDGLENCDWLRGNLHAHTTRSDGQCAPQAVIDDYAQRDYSFLMLSDHDVFSAPEDYAEWDARELILISGNEVTANGPHMLHVDADKRVEPHARRQDVLDDIAASKGFGILCHPNWHEDFNHFPQDQIEALTGYVGLEIYNGVVGRLPGSPYATDRWDMLLSAGRRVWGYAHDDSHHPDDVERGWNMVAVEEHTADAVVTALKDGRFYASTGVMISTITVKGMTITIETENAYRIVAIGQGARRLAQTDESDISIDVQDDTRYVRFECWGQGERMAWTQPFFMVP